MHSEAPVVTSAPNNKTDFPFFWILLIRLIGDFIQYTS
jgi:hypothetical protein